MKQRLVVGLAGIAAAIMLGGCAQDAPQDTWKPAGPNAQRIQNLQWPVFLVAGIVGVIVFATIIFVVIRFRDKGQEMPKQTHGKPALEIALTIIPAIILIGVGIPTVSTVFSLAKTSDTQCVINVTGQQWWWEYEYPVQTCGGVKISEPVVTSGELVMPVKTPVLLRITSNDVIHSYWIPKLNGKRDAVPGRIHPLRMEADHPGIYSGQCTEFCGLSHARMRMDAVGLTADDFSTWVANQLTPAEKPTDETALRGEDTFRAQCSRCHQVNGLTEENADGTNSAKPVIASPDLYIVSGNAPNLTHLMTRTTFAGATWDLLTDKCRDELRNAKPEDFGALYLRGVTPECFNEADLRSWVRNAPAKKPMFSSEAEKDISGGKYRGMPNLNLTDDQIDEIIAYLLER
ncbi:MAG TPA: cytochrome c oxidase subunit II, partial [Ilumatobacteraceae bacterium]|nr:cytochrome c oxidase subunit II [Ilumatobacteraceae bacterium]